MRFENLHYLILLILIPGLIIFLVWSGKKRRKDLERLAHTSLMERLLVNYHPKENRRRSWLLISGFTMVLIALLGPQWGYQWETVTHRGVDLIIAVDTSKSMLAEDIRPNRLERSKLVIHDLVRRLNGDRVGLITFAGTSFLQVPLTTDYSAFMRAVNALTTDIMPQGGTAIGEALENGIRAFESVDAESKVLILITDGEDHMTDPIKVAKKAAERGIHLIIIGMGTPEGDLIPTVQNGQRQFLRDSQGNVVKTIMDEGLLKGIASAGNGVYLSGTDSRALDLVYEDYIDKLKKSEISATHKKNYHQRYQIFLLLGIILISADLLVGIKKEVSS